MRSMARLPTCHEKDHYLSNNDARDSRSSFRDWREIRGEVAVRPTVVRLKAHAQPDLNHGPPLHRADAVFNLLLFCGQVGGELALQGIALRRT